MYAAHRATSFISGKIAIFEGGVCLFASCFNIVISDCKRFIACSAVWSGGGAGKQKGGRERRGEEGADGGRTIPKR